MQKCLGIYIESNIIKYAKVSKEKDDIKIESFGVRFFEDLNAEIKKIVEETFSFNTPISINLMNEKYLYFDIFALLNKKDIEKTVQTEFESYCEEKKYNANAFETRYALTQSPDEKEKFRAMDIFINKIELNRQIQPLEKYKLARVVPEAIAIGNLAKLDKRENQLIVNMEESTTITTILNKQIYGIETLDFGSKEVLDNINKVENSYAKSYEICKNTTIYTADVENTDDEQSHLQYIMPTIYKIAQKLQEIVSDNNLKYQKIYLTGTLASINNIDLYFQELLPNVECEILKPKFVGDSTTKINIKDYIEVNSAIALAANELGEGVQELNFKKLGTGEKLIKALNIEMPEQKKESKTASALSGKINFDLKGSLDTTEVWLVRGCVTILLILIIFMSFSKILSNSMADKQKEIETLTSEQQAQISIAQANASSLDSKTTKYNSLISDLEEIEEKASDIAASRNLIPNLLSQIMYAIPEMVQLDLIENATGKTVTIIAESTDYDQLGYFVAVLKTKKILYNVVSSRGSKSGGIVTITIEGDLP
jgi:Tfp pilus assembly protein PilN